MMTRALSLLVHGQCCLQLFLAISSSENGSANLREWEVYSELPIATAARAREREEDHWTVDPRYGASRGAAWMIRGGGVWSVKLASACSELAVRSLSSKDACRMLALDGHWSMPESLE